MYVCWQFWSLSNACQKSLHNTLPYQICPKMKMPMHLYATFDFLSNQLHISAFFCEIIVLARQVKSYEVVAIVHRLLLLLVDITQCTVSNPNLTFWIAKSRPLQCCSSTIIFLSSSKEPSGSSAIKSYTSIRPTSRGLGKEHTHCVLALLCTGCALHFGQRLDNLVTLGFLSSYK